MNINENVINRKSNYKSLETDCRFFDNYNHNLSRKQDKKKTGKR